MDTQPSRDSTQVSDLRSERTREMYLDALRMREWCIDVQQENGRLRWELESVRAAFNSAVMDVNYHMKRADDLSRKVDWMRASFAWRFGRLITLVPRAILRVIRRPA